MEVFALAMFAMAAHAQIYINEVLFNPPGTDSGYEYIELRGAPNSVIPAGTWFVAVNGHSLNDPGTLQNMFWAHMRPLPKKSGSRSGSGSSLIGADTR